MAGAPDAVGTTGAGAAYAAGFLFGLTRDLALAECGWIDRPGLRPGPAGA